MGTSYKVQIDNEKGEYKIQFETTNYDSYKMVERACQKVIDKKRWGCVGWLQKWKRKERYGCSKAFYIITSF